MEIQDEEVCRICLARNRETKCIFEEEVSPDGAKKICDMIMSCAPVQITKEDGLPEKICVFCIFESNRAYTFRKLCEMSDRTLRKQKLQISSSESVEVKTEAQLEIGREHGLILKQEPLEIKHDENVEALINTNDLTIWKCNNCDFEVTNEPDVDYEHFCSPMNSPLKRLTKANVQNPDEIGTKFLNSDEKQSGNTDEECLIVNKYNASYKCLTCQKTFDSNNSLLAHQRIDKCIVNLDDSMDEVELLEEMESESGPKEIVKLQLQETTRFGEKSIDEISEESKKMVTINTKRTNLSVWKQFTKFCQERGYTFQSDTPLTQLCKILQDWGCNMRKTDGENYKESVVKTMWNLTAKQLQERYYEKFNRRIDPFYDIAFKMARDARNAKRKELQCISGKRKKKTVVLSKEEYHKLIELWNENTPIGLQRKFYYLVTYQLAWKGGEAVSCLTYNFKEELDNFGIHTGRIEYNKFFSKNMQGAKNLGDSKWLTPAVNADLCPVRLLRKLLSKRSSEIVTDRLFLTPNPYWHKGRVWYKNSPVGVNEFRRWLKIDTQKIRDIETGANNSSQSSALSNLVINIQPKINIARSSDTIVPSLFVNLNAENQETYLGNDQQNSFQIINLT